MLRMLSFYFFPFFLFLLKLLYERSEASTKCHIMPNFKSYSPSHLPPTHGFFILCKGLNSGKPLERPCPNCFVCTCETPEERDFYFWLCYGLWQAKHWHVFLYGSVIPFITLPMFKKELDAQARHLLGNAAGWLAVCARARAINELQATLKQKITLLEQVKIAELRQRLQK